MVWFSPALHGSERNVLALEKIGHSRWVDQVLLREHTSGQYLCRIALQHRHHRLRQDLAMVQRFRHLVHCGAGKFATCINGTLVRMEPRERR